MGIVVGLVIITFPLAVNSTANVLFAIWTHRVHVAADSWISEVPGAEVDDVTVSSTSVKVSVHAPSELPPDSALLELLEGQVPDGIEIVVESSVGEERELGVVGG